MKVIAKLVMVYNATLKHYYRLRGTKREVSPDDLGLTCERENMCLIGKPIFPNTLVTCMFWDLMNKKGPSSIVEEILNFSSLDYRNLPDGNSASLSDLKNRYIKMFTREPSKKRWEKWEKYLRNNYSRLDNSDLVEGMKKLHELAVIYKNAKKKQDTAASTSVHTSQPYPITQHAMKKMEKHKQKILKCNKELGTLFSFHDSFLNIPPKRIYQKETYCLDLLFIVQTFLNEKKGYSIYGPHGYQLPITVNEMIVIAGKVFQYNNAVSRFQKLVETNKREAYTYAIDKGLTYFRENGQRVVGDYIELTQDRNQLLKFVFIDLLQKEPSLFLKIIIEKKLPPRVF